MWLVSIAMTLLAGACAVRQYYVYKQLVREVSSLHTVYQTCTQTLLCPEDNEVMCDDNTFIPVNRDKSYLEQEAHAFLQEHMPQRMHSFLRRHIRNSPRTRNRRTVQGNTKLALPIQRGKFWVSSLFGPRKQASGKQGFHYGVDFAAVRGTPVYASSDGVVVQAGWRGGYGNVIVIAHDNGLRTRYAHLSSIRVKHGQRVQRGAHIGGVGDTGHVRKNGRDASHLHFEVEHNGKRKNPFYYLRVE